MPYYEEGNVNEYLKRKRSAKCKVDLLDIVRFVVWHTVAKLINAFRYEVLLLRFITYIHLILLSCMVAFVGCVY